MINQKDFHPFRMAEEWVKDGSRKHPLDVEKLKYNPLCNPVVKVQRPHPWSLDAVKLKEGE